MKTREESWKEAIAGAFLALWFIMGAAAPAPLIPLMVIQPEGVKGWTIAVGLMFVATALWLGPCVLAYKYIERKRLKR
jgi:hypothetical protein